MDDIVDLEENNVYDNFKILMSNKSQAINTYMQQHNSINIDMINTEFNNIFNVYLPEMSRGRVQKNVWGLGTNMKFKQGQIVLLVSMQTSIRTLGIIIPSPRDDLAKGIIPEFQYSVITIIPILCKRNVKKHTLSVSHFLPRKLVTTRRGYFAVHMPTYEEGLVAFINKKNKWEIKQSNMERLHFLYYNYIDGMTKRPSKTFPRKQSDMGLEQFLLDEYPTLEWKAHTLKIKSRSNECDDDNEGNGHINYSNKKIKREKGPEEPDVEVATMVSTEDRNLDIMSWRNKLFTQSTFKLIADNNVVQDT
jgi:hypothetical protein